MLNITQDIQSLTSFKNDTAKFISNLKKTGRPTVLTVNGKAEVVVMDAVFYQKIQKNLELEETMAEINQSLDDFKNGRYYSAKEVFDGLKKRSKMAKARLKKK
jgi:PHD/YefM family antitoxin component YafN of YafNO toxin-antitoxin module